MWIMVTVLGFAAELVVIVLLGRSVTRDYELTRVGDVARAVDVPRGSDVTDDSATPREAAAGAAQTPVSNR